MEDQLSTLRLESPAPRRQLELEAVDGVVREALKAADASWQASFADLRRDVSDLRQVGSTLDLNNHKLASCYQNNEKRLSTLEWRLEKMATIQGDDKYTRCRAEPNEK